jgi:hypothetical protein
MKVNGFNSEEGAKVVVGKTETVGCELGEVVVVGIKDVVG